MKVLLIRVLPFNFSKKSFHKKQKKRFEIGLQSFFLPPVGLLYIAKSLEDEGHTVEIIDFYCEDNPIETLEKTLPSSDAVGLSVYTNSYKDTANVAQLIHQKDSDIPIIIGGPHCTIYPENALNDIPTANISVEGEGEFVIKDISKALMGRKKLSDIPGIRYRKNDKIKNGMPFKLIKNIDTIQYPARHLVEKYEYGKIYNIYFHKPKYTFMVTSRGCPFRCRFCNRKFLKKIGYRQRSTENVLGEIQEINEKYGSFSIVDDNFLVDPKRAHEIFDGIIKMGIDLEIYIQGARVDSADRNLYKKMKKAGVKRIFFGIESGCQDVLDFYKKDITLNQIRKAVDLSKEMGFFTIGGFILGAPIETQDHFNQSIKFACSLPLDITIWEPLKYKRGSEIWKEAVENGYIAGYDQYEIVADSKLNLGRFSKEELLKYCKKAFKKFHYRPEYIAREFIQTATSRDLTFLKVVLDYI
ncbi:MAG: radical SAM protein [Thermoplasmatales archaeon]|nr:MAG: radical SAM protein [Thermoplasmatales archaeon]